jgi:hypothetical protein
MAKTPVRAGAWGRSIRQSSSNIQASPGQHPGRQFPATHKDDVAECRFPGRDKVPRGLDDQGNLPICLHVILPAIDRLAGRKNIDTGRQAHLHQISRQFAGDSASGRVVKTRQIVTGRGTEKRMRFGFAGIIAVAIPALEIVGIYLVGSRIGLGWTLIWLLAAIFVGGAVIVRSGPASCRVCSKRWRKVTRRLVDLGQWQAFSGRSAADYSRPVQRFHCLDAVALAAAETGAVGTDGANSGPTRSGPQGPARAKSGKASGDVIEGDFAARIS